MPKAVSPGIFAIDVRPVETRRVGESVGKIGQNIGQDEFVRRWKIAEQQISNELRPHGLELHIDADGNYLIVPKPVHVL